MTDRNVCSEHASMVRSIERMLEALIGTEDHPGFGERMRILEWWMNLQRWFIGAVVLALTITAVGSLAQLAMSAKGQAANNKDLQEVTSILREIARDGKLAPMATTRQP